MVRAVRHVSKVPTGDMANLRSALNCCTRDKRLLGDDGLNSRLPSPILLMRSCVAIVGYIISNV
jgi:hypothetical protein